MPYGNWFRCTGAQLVEILAEASPVGLDYYDLMDKIEEKTGDRLTRGMFHGNLIHSARAVARRRGLVIPIPRRGYLNRNWKLTGNPVEIKRCINSQFKVSASHAESSQENCETLLSIVDENSPLGMAVTRLSNIGAEYVAQMRLVIRLQETYS